MVAFSLAGEQRQRVLAVAQEVEAILGRSTVFYDDWYTHWIAGSDADLLLQRVYDEKTELVVVCVSGAYGAKPWTTPEHRAVRARFMRAGTAEDRLRVLPLRVGDGEVEGILFNEIMPDIRTKTPAEVAELIIGRLNLVRGYAADVESAIALAEPQPRIPASTAEHSPGARSASAQPPQGKIFLCYRRDDTQGFARSIYDRLADKYGQEQVFRDIDSTPAGVKFSTWIDSKVSECNVMIVLMGNMWSSVKDGAGLRRLDDPKDWVRQEVEVALSRDIPIVPVRVQGAVMPSVHELPPSIADLTSFQSAEVTDSRWAFDMEQLIRAIDGLIQAE
jgi:hypothetical protein